MGLKRQQKKEEQPAEEMPEKIHKRIHLIYFTMFVILIALVMTSFIFVRELLMTTNMLEENDYQFVGHVYCGTFFLDPKPEDKFLTQEAYRDYMDSATTVVDNTVLDKIESTVMGTMSIVLIVCLFMALRNADKRRFFRKRSSRLLLIAGILYMCGNLWMEAINFSEYLHREDQYAGIFANAGYYFQIYKVLGMPALILVGALLLRQHEKTIYQESVVGNSRLMKIGAYLIVTVGGAFILYRLGVRVYELGAVLSKHVYTARLPFYSEMLDLPYELARSADAYTGMIGFRLFKDLPVFIASLVTVLHVANILLKGAKGEINTEENRKNLRISMMSLVTSSILFQLLGLYEIILFHQNFTGIFHDVTYTVGIRSDCEPIIYAFILFIITTLIQMIPEKSTGQ